MEPWHIWIVVAVLFLIIEIFTSGFAVACFSIGALAAAIMDLFGLNFIWQLSVFAVVSILALIFIRPLVVKLFYGSKEEKTNADALIGRTGRVSETVDPVSGKGRVAVDGDDWKAVSANGEVIQAGTNVKIIGRDSIIVTVTTINN